MNTDERGYSDTDIAKIFHLTLDMLIRAKSVSLSVKVKYFTVSSVDLKIAVSSVDLV